MNERFKCYVSSSHCLRVAPCHVSVLEPCKETCVKKGEQTGDLGSAAWSFDVTMGDIKMGKDVRGHSQPVEYHSYDHPYNAGDFGTRGIQDHSAGARRKGTNKLPSQECSQPSR